MEAAVGAPVGGPVRGVVREPSGGAVADAAADLLPDGVFCVDRLGTIVYANPRAARLLGLPRSRLLGHTLWEALPWLDQADYEDHLRGALLSPIRSTSTSGARPTTAAGPPRGPTRGTGSRSPCTRGGTS